MAARFAFRGELCSPVIITMCRGDAYIAPLVLQKFGGLMWASAPTDQSSDCIEKAPKLSLGAWIIFSLF